MRSRPPEPDPDEQNDSSGSLLHIPRPVAAVVLLVGLVGSRMATDAFWVIDNYFWSSVALIPLLETVSLNLALVVSVATIGWMLAEKFVGLFVVL